jgi:hypothetical protein
MYGSKKDVACITVLNLKRRGSPADKRKKLLPTSYTPKIRHPG